MTKDKKLQNGEEEDKGFHVIDRRFWAEDAEDDGEDALPTREDKPSYVAELEAKLAEKEALLKEYAREERDHLAELENAKARLKKGTDKELLRAKQDFLASFLDVIDNLDRALEAYDDSHDPAPFVNGVAMVRDLFLGKMAGFGVQKIDAQGAKFNPEIHEALSLVPVSDPAKDGQVVGVMQQGFMLEQSVLRPASVAVGKLTSDS